MLSTPLEQQKIMLQMLPISCEHQHFGQTCLEFGMEKFKLTFRRSMAYYLPFHLIPLLLYKRKELKQRYECSLT